MLVCLRTETLNLRKVEILSRQTSSMVVVAERAEVVDTTLMWQEVTRAAVEALASNRFTLTTTLLSKRLRSSLVGPVQCPME